MIDVAAPDQARVTGTLSLAAAGDQMYVLPGGEVVLLAGDGCAVWGSGAESQVLIVKITGGVPEVAVRVPLAGAIVESRLVGTALYVAAQTYRPVAGSDNTRWEWGTALSSIDLAQPTVPVLKDTLWYAGYGYVVTATDRFCFLAIQNPNDWRRSMVHTIDISAPDGTMKPLNTLHAAGVVADKFKLQGHGDVFTVISQVQSNILFTMLQTFSFKDPVVPRKLGELSLGLSERLHATRFAGDRVCVVTFFVRFQMDPLWVVDLSKPETPTVVGQLEIPGCPFARCFANRVCSVPESDCDPDTDPDTNCTKISSVPGYPGPGLGLQRALSTITNATTAIVCLEQNGLGRSPRPRLARGTSFP